MTPWRMSIIWTGTSALICISGAPARSAPSSRPANKMPIGLARPSNATVMASKPTVVA